MLLFYPCSENWMLLELFNFGKSTHGPKSSDGANECPWSREMNFWWSSDVWRQNTDASGLENWRFCKVSPKVSTSFPVFCSSNNLWLCCVLLRVHVVLSPCDRYVAVWCRILSQSFFYDSFKGLVSDIGTTELFKANCVTLGTVWISVDNSLRFHSHWEFAWKGQRKKQQSCVEYCLSLILTNGSED